MRDGREVLIWGSLGQAGGPRCFLFTRPVREDKSRPGIARPERFRDGRHRQLQENQEDHEDTRALAAW
jgi:hypothetical protein